MERKQELHGISGSGRGRITLRLEHNRDIRRHKGRENISEDSLYVI